jgi:hypothetical protein
MTQQEIEKILGPAASRASNSMLVWQMNDPQYRMITTQFFVSFDNNGKATFLSTGGGGISNPTVDVNVYHW